METGEHGRIITAAARSILRPIGCVQKGRSRTWLDDHGWWLGLIEFQPSAWSRGSYLNVGACWLWSANGYLSFNEGHRVEDFRSFVDSESFEQSARELADLAKEEILGLRNRFSSLDATAAYLTSKPIREGDLWSHFHAGVSAGLMGWAEKAKAFLESAIAVEEQDAEWVHSLKLHCTNLLLVVDDIQAFRRLVRANVAHGRAVLKLTPWIDDAQAGF